MRLAVFDVGGTAIKYAAMTDGEMDGKGEVPTPATCSGDFLAAIEGVLDALRAGMARLHETDLCYRFPPTIARGPQPHLSIWCPPTFWGRGA